MGHSGAFSATDLLCTKVGSGLKRRCAVPAPNLAVNTGLCVGTGAGDRWGCAHRQRGPRGGGRAWVEIQGYPGPRGVYVAVRHPVTQEVCACACISVHTCVRLRMCVGACVRACVWLSSCSPSQGRMSRKRFGSWRPRGLSRRGPRPSSITSCAFRSWHRSSVCQAWPWPRPSPCHSWAVATISRLCPMPRGPSSVFPAPRLHHLPALPHSQRVPVCTCLAPS